ncbi:MAG: hypothetical protein ACREXV_17605 [Polaromonas sp.]
MKNKSVKSHVRDVAARSSDAVAAPERKKNFSSAYRRVVSKFGKSYIVLGAGTVFDLSGSYLSLPEVGTLDRDAEQIRNDFSSIGSDFRSILGAQLKGIS